MPPHFERADLELLLAIGAHGSLAGAAAAAGVVPSVITKRLAALEARVGMKLFQRTTRRVVPTAEGAAVCERAAALLAQFQALEADLQERHREPVGASAWRPPSVSAGNGWAPPWPSSRRATRNWRSSCS